MNTYTYILCVVLAGVWPAVLSAQSSSDKLTYQRTFAPGEGFLNRLEKEFRNEICLNGLWDFQAVRLPADYQPGKGMAPVLPLPADGAWDGVKIKIPSPWNINGFANRKLEGPDHRNYPSYPEEWEEVKMAWMKKRVQIPAHWAGQLIKLHFEAVAGYTEVYVNEQKVGENFDIFLPFDIDITPVVKPGEWVDVFVGVRNQSLFEDRSTIGRRIIPAGSMWGYHAAGIWQDVYLLSLPKVNVDDVYVKPLVSEGILEVAVTLTNQSDRKESLSLSGVIREWVNRAGTDVHTAPVPNWELGRQVTALSSGKIQLLPGETLTTTLTVPIAEGELAYWTPEYPNLYSLIVTLHAGKNKVDTKYQRFGWREWTIQGAKHYLNGEPYQLKGDSWHFMGIPQLTRRYAWAWFTAIKAANGNAVRPHAQVYPRFYLEMADELGICVLDETAIWASDGGPKMDSPLFWDNCRKHIERLVLRDRNYPSVFGWSISNENKPVILNVFNRPDLMPLQKQAWEDWRNIVSANDPTRPWISSDGEDDGEGLLPVTVGHYGDDHSMKEWAETGKPWGIGEHSMAYYGTPEQVSVYNGERAYESQLGRMEGIAYECYHLLANQRTLGASYVSIFNLAWYALKPLPLGKKDLTSPPSLVNDGIFFTAYKEGMPGVQPERMGPYCTTFNPGYDPSLPLYEPWPLFDAIRAANAIDSPAWSPWMEVKKGTAETKRTPPRKYDDVLFIGTGNRELKPLLQHQGIVFASTMNPKRHTIVIVDGKEALTGTQQKELKQHTKSGADVWVWGLTPNGLSSINEILPAPVCLDERKASSFIPAPGSWLRGMTNSDFYFSEIQREEASEYGLYGDFVQEGEVMLDACNTDWRKWNKRPEELKTAAILRSENEAKGASPVFACYQKDGSTYLVSTLTHFADTEKGSNSLTQILRQLGIPLDTSESLAAKDFFDAQGFLLKSKRSTPHTGELSFWLFSPRPLDDLLIEPNVPKVDITVHATNGARIWLNNKQLSDSGNDNQTQCNELPLQQGWNFFLIKTRTKGEPFSVRFQSLNRPEFMSLLKGSFSNPDGEQK